MSKYSKRKNLEAIDRRLSIEEMLSKSAKVATMAAAVQLPEANQFGILTQKTAPVGADRLLIEDSEAGFVKKYIEITDLPAGAGTGNSYFPSGW